MRVLLVASQGLTSVELMARAVDLSGYAPSEVICGKALGFADTARFWALAHDIPLHADLSYVPKGLRRKLALGIADALIAVWDGADKEVPEMVILAQQYGCQAFLYCAGGRCGGDNA